MKNKTVLYRVYTKKGDFHHAYSAVLDGSKTWAIDCAKNIQGYVTEVYDGVDKEEEIFNFKTKTKS